jgi:hypothetical protein
MLPVGGLTVPTVARLTVAVTVSPVMAVGAALTSSVGVCLATTTLLLAVALASSTSLPSPL